MLISILVSNNLVLALTHKQTKTKASLIKKNVNYCVYGNLKYNKEKFFWLWFIM